MGPGDVVQGPETRCLHPLDFGCARKSLHFLCKVGDFSKWPERKLFVSEGHLGFFGVTLLFSSEWEEKGGGVDIELPNRRQVGLKKLRDLLRCAGHELIVRVSAN